MAKLRITDLNIEKKQVLMRVDYNVPLTSEGLVADPARILATLPTIEYILSKNASLVLMSHLGRPRGEHLTELSLKPIGMMLSKILNRTVAFGKDCMCETVREQAELLEPGQILLLENLRYYRAEEYPQEDPSFAQKLSKLGDIYTNEAFGCSHRKHSSIYEVAKYFPETAALGFLMEKEVNFLKQLLNSPKKPYYAFIGGAKISTKIGVLKSLLNHVDALIIGGAMAYTFFLAKGYEIGDSLVEPQYVAVAQEILDTARSKGIPVHLPLDLKVSKEVSESASYEIIQSKDGVPLGFQGVDIGPESISFFTKLIQDAKTVLWNGPFGVYEIDAFSEGTDTIAHALAKSAALSVVGGGDSIAAVRKAGVEKSISHLSTGGGATLEFLELGTLPGIEVLTEKEAAVKKL